MCFIVAIFPLARLQCSCELKNKKTEFSQYHPDFVLRLCMLFLSKALAS